MSRCWFVTGASRGLGHAIAETALAHGDTVVVTARAADSLDGLVKRYGDRAVPMVLDVTDRAAVFAAVAEAAERTGRIDVVLNNAGYGLSHAAPAATSSCGSPTVPRSPRSGRTAGFWSSPSPAPNCACSAGAGRHRGRLPRYREGSSIVLENTGALSTERPEVMRFDVGRAARGRQLRTAPSGIGPAGPAEAHRAA
ncbi:hypothetical protein SCYAM73S_04250 [Streptomyces cyaneofuscatus]